MEVYCQGCCEDFNLTDRMPKLLPCNHTLCEGCLEVHMTFDLLGRDAIECNQCRRMFLVDPDDFPTDLTTLKIVQKTLGDTTVYCTTHDGKKCCMVCVDCCKPLCTRCMKGIGMGAHRDHTIDEIDEAAMEIQETMNAKIEMKSVQIEKAVGERLKKLKEQSVQQEKDIYVVVAKVKSVLSAWRNNHLKKNKERVQEAIADQANIKSLKSSWKQKFKTTHFENLVAAKELIDKEIEKKLEVDVNLHKEGIDELKENLESLFEVIGTSVKGDSKGTGDVKDVSVKDVKGVSVKDGKGIRGVGVKDVSVKGVGVKDVGVKGVKDVEDDTKVERIGVVQDFEEMEDHCIVTAFSGFCVVTEIEPTEKTISTQTPPSSVCPKCNVKIPLYVERRMNIYNLKRNKKFLRVVHDWRRENNQLICKLDDFIFTFNKGPGCHTFETLWKKKSSESLQLLDTWNDVLSDPQYKRDIGNAARAWKQCLFEIRSEKIPTL